MFQHVSGVHFQLMHMESYYEFLDEYDIFTLLIKLWSVGLQTDFYTGFLRLMCISNSDRKNIFYIQRPTFEHLL